MRISPFKNLVLYTFLMLFTGMAYAQNRWVWGRGGTVSTSDAWGVTTDQAGNVYGAGIAFNMHGAGPGIDFGGGVTGPTYTASCQTVWVKYDNFGTPIWAGGTPTGSTWLSDITTDPSGNLIVFGTFSSSTMQIGSFTLTNDYASGTNQYYLAKISPSGTVLWAVKAGNRVGRYPFALLGFYTPRDGGVTTDTAGNIYITSNFKGASMSIGSTMLANVSGAGTYDVFVAKYTPGGVPVWASSIGGTDNEFGTEITVTTAGTVYVCGAFSSTSMAVGTSLISNPYPFMRTYIAEFSPTGIPLWGQAAGGPNGSVATALEHDNFGNIYMVGMYLDTSISLGGAIITRTYPSSVPLPALYLVRYDPSHSVTWSKTIGSRTHGVSSYSTVVSQCDQIWVSGSYGGAITIDTATLPPVTGSSGDPVFIAGYNIGGGVIGYAGLSSGGDDANQIACDKKGNVFLCADNIGARIIIGPDTLPAPLPPEDEFFYLAKYAIAAPDTAHSRHDTSYCGSDSMLIYAPSGYSIFRWDDGSSDSVRKVPYGTYWVLAEGCGLAIIDTVHVSFRTTDTNIRSHDTSVCINIGSATISVAAGASAYNWNTGDTASSLIVSVAGTYFVHALRECTLNIDTFHFSITPNDTTAYRKDTSVCNSVGSLRLRAPAGFSKYRWTTGDTTSSADVSVTSRYIVYSTLGCNVRIDTFQVTFLPVPAVDIGNDTTICTGSRVVLTSAQPVGSAWLWNTGSTNDTVIVRYSGLYKLTVTNSYGCKNSDSVTITVYAYPIVNLGKDTSLCDALNPALRSSVPYPAGVTYLWSTGSTSSAIIAPGPGKYWLYVDNHGCGGSDTVMVKASGKTPEAPTVTDEEYCQFDSAAPLTATGINLRWYTVPFGGVGSVISPVPSTADPGYHKWYVSQVSDSGCESKRTPLTVYVDYRADPMATQSDSILCRGNKVTFFALSAGSNMIGIHWDFGNGDSVSGFNPVSYAYDRKGEFATSFKVYYKVCPYKTGSVHVRVFDGPSGIYLGEDTSICPGGTPILFSDNVNAGNAAASWRWSTGNTSSHIYVTSPGTYFVKVSVNGCYLTDTVHVLNDCYINLPNVFTPNEDGLNDYFFPRQLLSKGLTEFSMNIYNRWGQLIFTTTSLEGRGWDGRFNGVMQPQGVFVYVIDVTFKDGQKEHHQGNVTLLK